VICKHHLPQIPFSCPICVLPHLHTWDNGRTFNTGGFGTEDAGWLFEQCHDAQGSIIETGAGLSTLIFLYASCRVVSIDGNFELIDRIHSYLADVGGQVDWTPKIGLSGELLPNESEQFSIALIDGGHGFPIPSVDFYYMNRLLLGGGLLIIDDAHLPAPREVILNLCESPTYYSLLSVSPSGKTYSFRKMFNFEVLPDFGGLGRDQRLSYSSVDINNKLLELRESLQRF